MWNYGQLLVLAILCLVQSCSLFSAGAVALLRQNQSNQPVPGLVPKIVHAVSPFLVHLSRFHETTTICANYKNITTYRISFIELSTICTTINTNQQLFHHPNVIGPTH